MDVPALGPNTMLSASNVNALNEPDIVNDPVITASPVNGNAGGLFNKCDAVTAKLELSTDIEAV
tara:strand:- start:18 stop:209 length:192 start_codon:yes stop_codon:yes gene_type:complete